MRSDQEIKELINLYILGALEENEKAEAEEYIKKPEYTAYYKQTKFLLAETSYSIEDYTLPESLKSELLSKIDTAETDDDEESSGGGGNVHYLDRFTKFGYAVAASIIAVLFIYSFYLNERLNDQALLLAELKSDSEHAHEFMEFINNPNVISIQLSGDSDSNAHGKLAWNKKSNDAILFVENLEMPEKNDVYQFWVENNDETVSEPMGTFKVNEDGSHMLFIGCMPESSSTKAIFVTMEPDGGMPHPTGMKYLAGYL